MKRNILILVFHLCLFNILAGQSSYEKAMQECQKRGYFESQECMIGMEIPKFEGTTYKGRKINNGSIRNKIAVINFWFMGCPPCIAELGGLNQVVELYGDREDVSFISFTRDNMKTLVEDFFPSHQLKFEIIPESESTILDVFKSWWGFPTTIVVDKSGKIHSITSGGKTEADEASRVIKDKLISSIEECLKK